MKIESGVFDFHGEKLFQVSIFPARSALVSMSSAANPPHPLQHREHLHERVAGRHAHHPPSSTCDHGQVRNGHIRAWSIEAAAL